MKLNLDCIRDILLRMEKANYQENLYPEQLYEDLPLYSQDVINYSIIKLNEAAFIKAAITNYDNKIVITCLNDITYDGHQFLANIRSDSVWNNIKEVGKKVGSNSITAISQIAVGVITSIINHQLGFN